MVAFTYKNGELYCEETPVKEIAFAVGTPLYIYSTRTIEFNYRLFTTALQYFPYLICFSVKSNSNLAILKLLLNIGAGFDIVSGGELFRILRIGTPPERIVYSGVGKTEEELRLALEVGILLFNVESEGELLLLNNIGEKIRKRAPVAIRVNPDVDPKTHLYITTGLKENKFGVDMKEALSLYRKAVTLPYIEIKGIDCHIGSQITEVEPFQSALKKLLEMVKTLKDEGIFLSYLDLGGGLGISYTGETTPSPKELGESIIRELQDLQDLTFIIEPGRSIVGNTGILVSKVLYIKEKEGKNFLIVDTAMNDLLRPSLYGAYHEIQPVELKNYGEFIADVVGPVCESGDFLAKNRLIQKITPGDLIAVMDAGAYGITMSSNYNSRPRVAEVLVKDNKFWVIRERETFEDLIKGENIPDF